MGWEGIAVGIAAVAGIVTLIYLVVRYAGRVQREAGEAEERAEHLEDADASRRKVEELRARRRRELRDWWLRKRSGRQ